MTTIDQSAQEVLEILENTENLETAQAGGLVSGFRAHCTQEAATESGVRMGRTLAREAYTSPDVREARKSGNGPTSVLKAAFRTLGANVG